MTTILASRTDEYYARKVDLTHCKRTSGVAGQYAVDVTLRYTCPDHPEDDCETKMAFIASIYGGPVVMVYQSGTTGQEHQTYVDRDVVERCGGSENIDVEWVAKFFGLTPV